MSHIDQIIAGITIAARGDDEAERAFAKRLDDLVEAPIAVQVVGRELLYLSVESSPKNGRPRAVVTDGECHWRVNLDALEFQRGTPQRTVVRAYRHWLGHDVHEGDSPTVALHPRAVSRQHLRDRVAELDDTINDTLATLNLIHSEELEPDPAGATSWRSDEQHRPDVAYKYHEEVQHLRDRVADIARLIDAGAVHDAQRLLTATLSGLGGLTYEYSCPDEVQLCACAAIDQWLRCLHQSIDDPPSLRHFLGWIDEFKLFWKLKDWVDDIPHPMHPPLLEWLESQLGKMPQPNPTIQRPLSDALTHLRATRGELELIWERLPPHALSGSDITVLLNWLADDGRAPAAIDIADQWLAEQTALNRFVSTAKVEQTRRALLAKLGQTDQAIDELWSTFEAFPTPNKFAELLELTPQDRRDDLRTRVADQLSDHPSALIDLAANCEPFDSLARAIEALDIDELRSISSRTLEKAAPRLISNWPHAAVKAYCALGWRHVDRGKSTYYHLAIDAFKEARDLYRRLDRDDDWKRLVDEVTQEHGRKYTFIPAFQKLAE